MNLQVNDTFSIKTYRQYNVEKNLRCTVVKVVDAPSMEEVTINVVDESSNIKFHVCLCLNGFEDPKEVQGWILNAYDFGHYSPGHLVVEPVIEAEEVMQEPKQYKILSRSSFNQEVKTISELDGLEEARDMFKSIIEPAEENGWKVQVRNDDFDYSMQSGDWTSVWIEGEGAMRPDLGDCCLSHQLISFSQSRLINIIPLKSFVENVSTYVSSTDAATLKSLAEDNSFDIWFSHAYPKIAVVRTGVKASVRYFELTTEWHNISV